MLFRSKLHVYNGASGATPFAFSPLAVESNGHTYINLLSPAANETAILFGQPGSSANGVIMYNNTSTPNGFQFRNNGNITRMVINNLGAVGIGTITPSAMLDVAGSIRATGLTIVSGGQPSDFLIKNDAAGTVGFRKGHTGLGLNYIIALQGVFPSQSGPFLGGETYIGEVKLFSGNNAPFGWAICNGQILPVSGNETLFALIGTTYGGNGTTNFGLPDLSNRAPVGVGSNWSLGENSN